MTQISSSLLSLVTRGVATTAAMLSMKRVYQQYPDLRFDFEMELEYTALKAKFEAFAEALSRRTMNASAADMQTALCHASSSPFSDHQAWTTLVQKLSTSEDSMDKDMAKVLGMFAS